MIRPFRAETERYGEYSKAGEFVYDHPFQFGSRRIGPDLHRVGGKYPDMWHYNHMLDPKSPSPTAPSCRATRGCSRTPSTSA
jgi:cytochrome c oxidase cbb3-type subunit I/II